MNAPVIAPAFADLIDEGIANAVKAQRHLLSMDPAKRAALEAEWLAGEAAEDRKLIEAERRAKVKMLIDCGVL